MNCLLRCEYDMDTGCVELRFMDGTQISIDCRAVEIALDADTLQRGELDWLIYNKPLRVRSALTRPAARPANPMPRRKSRIMPPAKRAEFRVVYFAKNTKNTIFVNYSAHFCVF